MTKMISIKSVSLKNFRNYKDAEVILKDNTGVFFIFGDNGGGKTTLLNAINWCLYGDIVFHGVNPTPIVKPSWASDDDVTEVSMIICDDDKRYSFRRTTSGFNNDGVLTAREINDSNNSTELPNFERDAIIKRLLPENIKNLFFLSENFSNEILGQKSTNSLKTNIYKVSELDTIENAIRHLNLTQDYYVKNISKATKDYDKIQKLNDDIVFARKGIAKNEEDIQHATDKITEHKASLSKLEEILNNSKQIRELVEQRDFLKGELSDIDDALEHDKGDIVDCLQFDYHKVLLLDGIEQYKEALNAAREEGRIPAPINPKIMQQSRDSGKCACCGKDIDEESERFMTEQQRKYEEIDKLKFLSDGINEFADIKDQIKESWYKLKDALSSQEKNNAKRDKIVSQLDNISEKIDESAIANLPNNPEQYHQELLYKIEKWEVRRREYAQNVKDFKDLITKSQGELARLMNSAGGDIQSLQAELDRLENLKDLLDILKKEAEIIIRERIRTGVWESFKKILSDTQFAEITLDENYIFGFIDKQGFQTNVGNLCVGEAKTLALSLVSTLSNDIGYSDTPLFIDNLFHGIEATHFSDVTKCVESLADKKQIFITYLHSSRNDEGLRISKNFNPTIVKQEFGAIKDVETGICNIKEKK